ncbi:MAG: hypothetical protein P8Q32_03190 [Candidatus Thalassarchaeaceae archaeon]|nr:hypothetical protein [Euryarchaeota archaeon]MDG1542913.1 hypothetical protein [Candidatus Thalassarchaeaceae archaeon]
MQHVALLAFDKERCKPFFDRLTELFYKHHHSEQQKPEEYEKLLYMVRRPYDNDMLDMIDEWMESGPREWREETTREVKLALYAIRYPDTLLLDSFTEKPRSDIKRLSSYLHFTHHTYAIWDEDTRKGLEKLGINIPSTKSADPFIYGAYVSAIELLKDVAPFTCFLEHDVPRQRLFQSALAAYGREE